MGTFAVGEVVLVAFPYADFTRFKKRPALVVGLAEFDNVILCQITSKADTSMKAIFLSASGFQRGDLEVDSYVRPDKIFTIEQSLIKDKVGRLKSTKLEAIKLQIRRIFS